MFEFLVYTVWACLKGVIILYKTLKEETTNKNHYDDNYKAPFACRFSFFQRTVFSSVAARDYGYWQTTHTFNI